MENQSPKPWYKNKIYLTGAILFGGLLVVGSIGNSTEPVTAQPTVQQTTHTSQTAPKTYTTQPKEITPDSQTQTTDTSLSNDNYYTNTAGNKVHSPAYSDSLPDGASARCRDGTYSFSQSRRGTCSHHGGVAEWL